jgi:hypothetical protein
MTWRSSKTLPLLLANVGHMSCSDSTRLFDAALPHEAEGQPIEDLGGCHLSLLVQQLRDEGAAHQDEPLSMPVA